ncbi:MAG: ATP cone domain-containing protein [Candidatus Spechtbacterales bacterium]|nr:ATP cone domain-containing protein [Candidatus Spechtbacterales bacterium]
MALKSPFKHSFKHVRKRDGRIVEWDQKKITKAIAKAMKKTGEGNLEKDPQAISDKVVKLLAKKYSSKDVLNIEQVQDVVEDALILGEMPETAKEYIVYRRERAKVRDARKDVPEHVQKKAEESKKYFQNDLGEFIYYRSYSRWIEEEGRRETWVETVDRYMQFMKDNIGDALTEDEYSDIREAILKQEIMPSMRLMWSAGKAAARTNVSAYNCSYIAPSQLEDFAEIMYLSMCGTGVGFSAESQNVQQLPIIKPQTGEKVKTHVVHDSKEGWGDALTLGLKTWFDGKDIEFDYSELRPAGARLMTMGGRSSGPEPLRSLLDFTRDKIKEREGKRLRNIDVHDIVCKIGEVVVAGGVRRSALISLSDLDDEEMRSAKEGKFYLYEPQRQMANNSAAYNRKPTAHEFMEEWLSLAKAGTGERGIFNRAGLKHQMPKRRWEKFAPHWAQSGTNPCGEITLRSKQFCNLSEVVARADDTEESLMRKVRLATILGTYQSSLTKFPYLSKEWKKNCQEERLLGVSVTGQWDSNSARDPEILSKLKEESIRVNEKYAKRMGINPSTSITCVKPSGTVSQLVDSSSGMHPRHSKYYIRRVRIAATDSLFHMLRDQKFPHKPEVGQDENSATTFVLEFPIKAPDGAITKDSISALDQLEHWKDVKTSFTEHNPSVTVSVGDDEWISTANWLYSNWEMLGGLSFLPRNDHHYALAPYEEITEERYNELMAEMPDVDFSHIVGYEKEDYTKGAKQLACVGGTCEIEEMAPGMDPSKEAEHTESA